MRGIGSPAEWNARVKGALQRLGATERRKFLPGAYERLPREVRAEGRRLREQQTRRGVRPALRRPRASEPPARAVLGRLRGLGVLGVLGKLTRLRLVRRRKGGK